MGHNILLGSSTGPEPESEHSQEGHAA